MGAFDDALVLGLARLQHDHLGAQHAAERLAVAGQLDPTATIATDRSLAVPDQGPRHRPQRIDQLPPAGEEVLGTAGRDQDPPRATASSPVTIVSTGSCVGVRTWPNPTGSWIGGNHKSHCAMSPAT